MIATKNIIVKDKQTLNALQNHELGEIAICSDTKEMFTWDGEEWIPANIENKGLKFNLYELNKNIINQMTPMTPDEINMKTELINDYAYSIENTHYMLLCRDYNYYTVFSYSEMFTFSNFATAVCTIISELGEVYSIDYLDDKAIEIWIKPIGEENPYAFYLFPYDAGVVYYG